MSDHTAGAVLFQQPTPAEAVAASRQVQVSVAVVDSLGLCYIAFTERAYLMEKVTEITNAYCSLDLRYEDIQEMGKAVLKEERAFNIKARLAPGADRYRNSSGKSLHLRVTWCSMCQTVKLIRSGIFKA